MKLVVAALLIACSFAALWFAFPYVFILSWGVAGFPVAMIAGGILIAAALTAATFLWRWARQPV